MCLPKSSNGTSSRTPFVLVVVVCFGEIHCGDGKKLGMLMDPHAENFIGLFLVYVGVCFQALVEVEVEFCNGSSHFLFTG